MGITILRAGRKLHGIDQLSHAGENLALIAISVHPHGLGNTVTHTHFRIQRGCGVLKDEPELGTQRAQLALTHAHELLPKHPHRTRGRLLQRGHASPDGRLSGARLPHQPEGLPTANTEAHIVDRTER